MAPVATTEAPATTAPETTTTTTAAPAEVVDAPAISGTALPNFEPDNETAIGQVAPEVVGASFDGSQVSINHDGENYKMIVFLAHWCPHCQTEVPVVRDWLAEYDLGENIEIFSVSTAEREDRGNWPPVDWLEGEEWPVPVLEDTLEVDVGRAYGLTAFPYWVFLDKDGGVLLRTNGLTAEALTEIVDEIKAFDDTAA